MMIGRTLGHYRVVEKLGEGGMGRVFRAEATRLRRSVAIKLLPEEVVSDPERIAASRSSTSWCAAAGSSA